MSSTALVALAVLPWVLFPLAVLWQLRDIRTLNDYSAAVPAEPPLISVIIPARNEGRNIEACVWSILVSKWPNLEVIVADDHSSDRTRSVARHIARSESRVRVVDVPDLPSGWFGKQWACHTAQQTAAGAFFLFTDADTRHRPELIARSLSAMRERGADLLSVAGEQKMESFWERLLQPHLFALIIARYGGPERMSRSRNPYNKLANGQFILVQRETYLAAGGHEAVRSHVAEDLRMAQEWTRRGLSVHMVAGFDHLTTRMYNGLGDLLRGWGKNIYAAGRDTLPFGPAVQALLRITYPLPSLFEIIPAAVALAWLAGVVPSAVGAWGAIAYGFTTLYWMAMQRGIRAPVWYAVLHPLAAVVLFWLFATAAWKGDRVEWKGRKYRSA